MPISLRYSTLFLCVLAAGAQTLIDNDQVRVIKVVDQPHVKTKPHDHKVNRVMIYLQPGRQEIVSGGKTAVQEWKAGEVKWSPATATHTAEIMSAEPVTMVEVELKKPASGQTTAFSALDPVKVEPKRYHVEFENPQVRVLRVRIGPKEKVALHEHGLNRVVVYLTDADTVATTPEGKSNHSVAKAGDVIWGGPAKHSEVNLSARPFEVVVVELKN